jgi:hypothetical protein
MEGKTGRTGAPLAGVPVGSDKIPFVVDSQLRKNTATVSYPPGICADLGAAPRVLHLIRILIELDLVEFGAA